MWGNGKAGEKDLEVHRALDHRARCRYCRVRHRRPRGDRDRQWASCVRQPGLRAGHEDRRQHLELVYRIIGIDHDDLADGSGKAGLTFEATSKTFGKQRINANDTNVGGWKVSELRGRLNSGDLWSLLPTDFTGKIRPVTKMTDNQGGGTHGQPTATIDKVFIISTTEFFGDLHSDGVQYEYYKDKGVTLKNYSMNEAIDYHWTRSVNETYTVPGYEPFSNRFCYTMSYGPGRGVGDPSKTENVFPVWCF